jgi:hypothetical protein
MREDPLVAQVLSGESLELQILAAQGILPLAPEQLIPLQVRLTGSDDPLVADYSRTALAALDTRFASAYLGADAPADVIQWFAVHSEVGALIEAILRRRDVERGLLVNLARRLPADLQEILLLRQDAIVERPEILAALEENPAVSSYAQRRILEYREHLLPQQRPVEPEAVPETGEPDLTEEDWHEIRRVQGAVAREGEVDERTGLSEAQIRALPVPVRMKLSRGASRTLRNILLKDSHPLVAVSALQNSAVTEDEVEQLSNSRTVVEDVLAAIARKREWVSRYNISLNLVRNPRTPVGMAVRLVSRLSVRDLKPLARDRNVSDAVRSTADRLYKIKNK